MFFMDLSPPAIDCPAAFFDDDICCIDFAPEDLSSSSGDALLANRGRAVMGCFFSARAEPGGFRKLTLPEPRWSRSFSALAVLTLRPLSLFKALMGLFEFPKEASSSWSFVVLRSASTADQRKRPNRTAYAAMRIFFTLEGSGWRTMAFFSKLSNHGCSSAVRAVRRSSGFLLSSAAVRDFASAETPTNLSESNSRSWALISLYLSASSRRPGVLALGVLNGSFPESMA
mmetsp:Transcript_21342/g.57006  ORF Transcript_21342/g.57006 Transcript_21342/m.57006 type:complete len:229 (+) Transcript_21342:553-1239(+)